MIEINPAVKFSYDIVKGSPQKRREFVQNLNKHIFDTFQTTSKDDKYQTKDLIKIIKKILPEKKKIKIKEFDTKKYKDFDGASDLLYDDYGNITGQTLELPTEKGTFGADVVITARHEVTHILDVLSNPKYPARTQMMTQKNKYVGNFNDWYSDTLYNIEKYKTDAEKADRLKVVKEKTEQFLKRKTNVDKINYIQDARYTLETERNAYKEQMKEAKRQESQGKQVKKTDLYDWDKAFLFTEKIELLKQMGKEYVAKERARVDKSNR